MSQDSWTNWNIYTFPWLSSRGSSLWWAVWINPHTSQPVVSQCGTRKGSTYILFNGCRQEATHAGGWSGYSHIQATSGIAMWDRKGPYSVAATWILKAAIWSWKSHGNNVHGRYVQHPADYVRGDELKELASMIGLMEAQMKVLFENRRKYTRGLECE